MIAEHWASGTRRAPLASELVGTRYRVFGSATPRFAFGAG